MTDQPTPQTIRAARTAADLTQTQAAATVYRTPRNWQQWESGERGMDPALFELFCHKAGVNCRLCGHAYGNDWLDDGETCPHCRLVQ